MRHSKPNQANRTHVVNGEGQLIPRRGTSESICSHAADQYMQDVRMFGAFVAVDGIRNGHALDYVGDVTVLGLYCTEQEAEKAHPQTDVLPVQYCKDAGPVRVGDKLSTWVDVSTCYAMAPVA